ncbi:MAG: bifunctional glutamate N-acetyltransferase/amino-acid acetyltransferase ArgJ [Paracoccaceae bacterium]
MGEGKARKAAKTVKAGKSAEKKIARLKDRAAALRDKLAGVEAKLVDLGAGAVKPEAKGSVSPFARPFPDLPEVRGVRFAAAEAGVRYKGRKDVMLAEIAAGSTVAGVFTRSATRSAPVDWCRARLAGLAAAALSGPLGIVVNSGNANAFTGDNGMRGVEAVAEAAAAAIGGDKNGVFVASTGVIGEPLPAEKITAHLADMAARLSGASIRDAADAIMTTDTFAKGAGRVIEIDGVSAAISGFAKGSGMIAPDMATMLAFVFTDAPVGPKLLQSMVSEATKISFNAATVDSDTSTSDTLIVAATGQAGGAPILSRRDPRAAVLEAALREVLIDLAQAVVRDGEGITKYVAVKVTGAASENSAAIIARSIANSPLVKTAIAGEDPNWGRIVMAVGKSGQPAERDRLAIWLGDILVAEKGWVAESYSEAAGAAYMKRSEIEITADIGVGNAEAVVWTCDLTHRYIEINADYRS